MLLPALPACGQPLPLMFQSGALRLSTNSLHNQPFMGRQRDAGFSCSHDTLMLVCVCRSLLALGCSDGLPAWVLLAAAHVFTVLPWKRFLPRGVQQCFSLNLVQQYFWVFVDSDSFHVL